MAKCDGKSENFQNTNECGGIVQDKSFQVINASDAGNKPITAEKL